MSVHGHEADVSGADLSRGADLERAIERVKDFWKVNCSQLAEFDTTLSAKDEEIARLKQRLERPHSTSPILLEYSDDEVPPPRTETTVKQRRGRAPPVDPFTGEDPEFRLEDWLPALQRATKWNGWTETEELIQLAGHLRGKALMEWNLLEEESRSDLNTAVKALKDRLEPGSGVLAAQDF